MTDEEIRKCMEILCGPQKPKIAYCDKNICKECQWSSSNTTDSTCNHLLITGERRKINREACECLSFKKGKKMELPLRRISKEIAPPASEKEHYWDLRFSS